MVNTVSWRGQAIEERAAFGQGTRAARIGVLMQARPDQRGETHAVKKLQIAKASRNRSNRRHECQHHLGDRFASGTAIGAASIAASRDGRQMLLPPPDRSIP